MGAEVAAVPTEVAIFQELLKRALFRSKYLLKMALFLNFFTKEAFPHQLKIPLDSPVKGIIQRNVCR